MKPVRRTAIAIAVATTLAGAAHATPGTAPASAEAAPSVAATTGQAMYFVNFTEAGLVYYRGGIDGLRATAPSGDANGRRQVDVRSAASRAYLDHLAARRREALAAIESALGRPVPVPYVYEMSHHGIAVSLTEAEAQRLRSVPGVAGVEADQIYQLFDERSPQFLGAPGLWDGSQSGTTPPTPADGRGVVVGIFDSGINLDHPAFGNDASCGHSVGTPKLMRAYDCIGGNCTEAPTANDGNGHGSHVASSAIGNRLTGTAVPTPAADVSGVAPCARVVAFKVCDTGCPGSAIAAGINRAVADGEIDVANFSLGPSFVIDPWTTGGADGGARALVANDVFVAFAAGNTNASVTNPVGAVVNVAPWVMTVANSSNDRAGLFNLTDFNPGGPQDQGLLFGGVIPVPAGGLTAPVVDTSVAPISNVQGCNPGFPADSLTGRIALIDRGTCSFRDKVQNAQAAGAVGVIVRNNAAGFPIPMGGLEAEVNPADPPAPTVPALMISDVQGTAVRQFLAATPGATATIPVARSVVVDAAAANRLNGGSLRGPLAALQLAKPNVAAPGTSNYDAYRDPEQYSLLSGTSMASPQVAGGGALLRAIHPAWTPMEVHSALMLTASGGNQFLADGTTPATADDVGSGMIDLGKAARAGFVLNETQTNFLAANPAATPPGDPRTLNLASMRNTSCAGECSWTRTLRNTRTNAVTWTVSVVEPAGVTLVPSASSIAFTGSLTQSQPITVQARIAEGTTITAARFGTVVFTPSDASLPVLRMTVTIAGTGSTGIFANGFEP